MQLIPNDVLSYFSSAEVEQVSILARNSTSITYLVELEEFQYVLKKYPVATAYSAVPVNEESLQFLFVSGFDKLCKLLLASDDSTNYEAEDGSIWVAREYIEADSTFDWQQCNWEEAHCKEAGALLAEMHARAIFVAHDLELLQVNTSVLVRSKISEELLRSKSIKALVSVLDITQSASVKRYIDQIDEVLKEFITLLGAGSGNPSRLRTAENWMLAETVLNHGDFHPGNILFSGSKAQAVIDFDYANFNTPAIELGYALFMFAITDKINPYDKDKSVFSQALAKAFLDAYFLKLRKIENIHEYDFEPILKLLEPRIKLAALYTLFWATDCIAACDSAPRVEGELANSSNLSSVSKGKATSEDADGFYPDTDKLVKVAQFCLDYFFID